MTPQQVEDLENQYISKIKQDIEKEIQIKLGLSLT